MKVSKGLKHKCRVRPCSEEKLNKLYERINIQCRCCQCDCRNEIENNKICTNRKDRKYELNEIIELLKINDVNILKLCEKNSLKLNILIEMLRGNMILNFKYYTILVNHLEKFNEENYKEYQQIFEKESVDI